MASGAHTNNKLHLAGRRLPCASLQCERVRTGVECSIGAVADISPSTSGPLHLARRSPIPIDVSLELTKRKYVRIIPRVSGKEKLAGAIARGANGEMRLLLTDSQPRGAFFECDELFSRVEGQRI